MEEPARAAVPKFGALVRLARAHVLGDVDIRPTQQAKCRSSDPVLARPKCLPSGTS